MRISYWSSDVCSSDRAAVPEPQRVHRRPALFGAPCVARMVVQHHLRLAEQHAPAAAFAALGQVVEQVGAKRVVRLGERRQFRAGRQAQVPARRMRRVDRKAGIAEQRPQRRQRSEEHTSELKSLMRIQYTLLCLKKKQKYLTTMTYQNMTTRLLS